MIKDADEIVKQTIALLLLKDSYWGYLMAKLKRFSDENLPTIMAVSIDRDCHVCLWYNPNLVKNIKESILIKIIEHEGMHILNNHIGRLLVHLSEELDKKNHNDLKYLWNIACDCAVNSLINFPRSITINDNELNFYFPENYDLPGKQTAEFYYDKLLKQIDPKKDQPDKNGNNENDETDQNNNQNNNNGDNNNIVNDNTNVTLVDDHKKWIEDIKNHPDLRSTARKIESYTKDIIKESLRDVKNRGNLPSFINNILDKYFSKPKVPYYRIISNFVKGSKLTKFKTAYSKINRKRIYLFHNSNYPMISPFPGKTKDATFKICIIIDTSGSMDQPSIIQGLSGSKDIIENDSDCKVTIVEIDTQIHRIYDIKRISDIQFNVHGGGGTRLFDGLEYAKKEKYDVALVFSDGYCENFNEIDRKLLPKKILWVITPGGTSSYVNRVGYTLILDKDKNMI